MPCSNYEGEGAKPPKHFVFISQIIWKKALTQVGLTARIKEYTVEFVLLLNMKRLVTLKFKQRKTSKASS